MISNTCIVCGTEAKSFGSKPDYHIYSTVDPSGVSSGIKRIYDFVKCPKCSLYWVVNPDENYEDLYAKGDFWNEYQRDKYERPTLFQKERLENDLKYAKLRIPDIKKFITKSDSKILDIGCSSGALLKELQEVFPDSECCGIEPNFTIAKAAQIFCECKIYDMFLTEETKNNIPPNFDMIFALDVLEHLTNPLNDIKLWVEKLAIGGHIWIECPDSGCEGALNSGLDWHYVVPTEHIYYYKKLHVKMLFERFGCKLIEANNLFTTDRQRCVFKKIK